jgi:hypothetical protein
MRRPVVDARAAHRSACGGPSDRRRRTQAAASGRRSNGDADAPLADRPLEVMREEVFDENAEKSFFKKGKRFLLTLHRARVIFGRCS